MSVDNKLKGSLIAKEIFVPDLQEPYSSLFANLIQKLNTSLSINRVMILDNEIEKCKVESCENELECLKYVAALMVMRDLSQQGWIFDIEDGRLVLRMENDNVDDKAMLRYRLSAERNAQFKQPSIIKFIQQMEKERAWGNEKVSIKNLIGSPRLLIESIQSGQKVCDPYIQRVTDEKDEYTGLKLLNIWRYFRYTWSIPYKMMPGRNIYYLVRDRLQPFHPIIGIFALGNSVLNLTVRDNDIGWTVNAISHNLTRKSNVELCEQKMSEVDSSGIKVKVEHYCETKDEFAKRVNTYSDLILPLLVKNVDDAIDDIYVKDLGYHRQTKYPKQEQVEKLLEIAAEYAEKAINNKNNIHSPNWEEEARSNLFTRKRASELAKLLATKIVFNEVKGNTCYEKLSSLVNSEKGRKAINTALIANRKCKIGSNMMEIIVCGAIPPYNELLCGKLVSMLACSPMVIRDYTQKYNAQISEIASRMKGAQVIRNSQLVYLGTTSLYSIGSSQYNRINVPLGDNFYLKYRKMGVTEGFGTVFFSNDTTETFSRLLELQDGGKRISHVFGEGTSPRFRMISRGLSSVGIKADRFLKHYSPRIVYSIDLARNTNEYLLGIDDKVDYGYNIENEQVVMTKTQEIIDYWYNRWLETRLKTVDIKARLGEFRLNNFLLGNI